MSEENKMKSGPGGKILGFFGSFSEYRFEDWISLFLFWVLNVIVFYQFYTRYVLGSAAAWTEEISRYLLVSITFVGSSMCVRRNSHILLDFLYRCAPARVARVLSFLNDAIRTALIAYAAYLSVVLLPAASKQRMIMFNLSMGWLFVFVVTGFVLMLVRSILVTSEHKRCGWAVVIKD